MRDTHRERQRHKQREKHAPCREPDEGLDPRTPGSHPGPKAGAKPLSHPGVPRRVFTMRKFFDSMVYQLLLSLCSSNIPPIVTLKMYDVFKWPFNVVSCAIPYEC